MVLLMGELCTDLQQVVVDCDWPSWHLILHQAVFPGWFGQASGRGGLHTSAALPAALSLSLLWLVMGREAVFFGDELVGRLPYTCCSPSPEKEKNTSLTSLGGDSDDG